MGKRIAEKALLFGAIMAIVVLDDWKLVIVSVPLGIMLGAVLGIFYVRHHAYYVLSQRGEEISPRWMVRLAGTPPVKGWDDMKRWAVILGGVLPLVFLIFQVLVESSWAELIFPISMLSTWVLSILILECVIRVKYRHI